MTAHDYFQTGQLKEALAAVTADVKKAPGDTARRGFLAELLCFAGELERADVHLDAISSQAPQAAVGVSLFRQLVRAEKARHEFFAQGRVPEFLDGPSEALRLHLEASIRLREGKPAEAVQLLQQAEQQRQHRAGVRNGQRFDEFRDTDDLTACFFEVLTSTGKYYWVPFERVELVEFRPPARPRDLLWPRARMVVRGGPDGEVYLPALYHGSHAEPDDRFRLGRMTDWRGGDGAPVRGLGLRTFLVGEDARSILELKELAFDESGASPR